MPLKHNILSNSCSYENQEFNYPAYALKSDDGKNQVSNYPAYAVKGDDSKKKDQQKTMSLPML